MSGEGANLSSALHKLSWVPGAMRKELDSELLMGAVRQVGGA